MGQVETQELLGPDQSSFGAFADCHIGQSIHPQRLIVDDQYEPLIDNVQIKHLKIKRSQCAEPCC